MFSMFQFFKFSFSALPSLSPASLSEHSLSVSLLVLLPAILPGGEREAEEATQGNPESPGDRLAI
jgi:hypothetical protein